MHIESLPEGTRRVLLALSAIEQTGRFVLVGGTALALYAAHRVSEDLDFAFVSEEKLPRKTIDAIVKALAAKGFETRFIERPDAAIEFSEATLDILDYQQDYEVDRTKLTFFTHEERALFSDEVERASMGSVRIASQREIFDSKSIMFARFCRSRDVFDLWWLMEHAGFGVEQMCEAFVRADQSHNLHTAFSRIREQSYAPADPGYMLFDASLPDRDEARRRLSLKIQDWLEQAAMRALAAKR